VATEAGAIPLSVLADPPPTVRGRDNLLVRAARPSRVTAESAAPVVLPPVPPISPPALTPREAQLLAALAADPAASSAALGRGLGIAAGTVRKALGGLREKLGAGKDADGAALVALARGLLADEAAIGEGGSG
jgi:DNA-binding CsgD family transcriptional regulator